MKITVQAFVRENNADEKRASDLLKEATAKKGANDIDGAIRCLREAYILLERSPIVYPIETYLRLPLYLQKAGRFEEAQREFQGLLIGADARVAREFVHQDVETRKGAAAMKRAGIYRAMCTAYRRERKESHVVLFTLLNHACQCVGLKHQERGEELLFMRSKEVWKKTVDDLLEDTKLASKGREIVDACLRFSKECTETAFAELESELGALILREGEQSPPVTVDESEVFGAPSSDDDQMAWLDHATRLHLTMARDAWKAGDFAAARTSYLKTAQALTQIKEADRAKAMLKQEQIEFAKADPLYQQVIAALRPIVSAEPGILQTAIYDRLPFPREDIGYALYFAHQLGDLYRRKKGRTYEVLPAGVIIDQR